MRKSEFKKQFAETDERKKEEKNKINRPILEEVIIGKNVKSLKEVPKEAYDKAKKLIIAEGIKEIPDDFLVCNQYIEEIKLPESLERIGNRAFGNIEKIKNIDIPDSVREIGDYAFFRSYDKKISLPKSVEKLGRRCIRANVKEIEIDANNKHLKLDGDMIISIDGKRLIMAFNITGKKICKIPEGIEHIERNAFAGCKFENIILPESLAEIGESAFRGCDISHLIVPDGISSLGFAAFSGCNIGELKLPCNLKRIEGRCFEYARAKELKLPDSVEYIGELAFY
ncbi:MAG: leucine-rich repeat domain-containing protein [Catonella sp.]